MTSNPAFVETDVSGSTLGISFTSRQQASGVDDPEIRAQILKIVMEQLSDSTKQVVLDLHNLDRINSAMLGFFVRLSKELEHRTIDFGVTGASPSVHKVMELTRLTHFLKD